LRTFSPQRAKRYTEGHAETVTTTFFLHVLRDLCG